MLATICYCINKLYYFSAFSNKQFNFCSISMWKNVQMSISSIWHRDSNPRPFKHESSPITTLPGQEFIQVQDQRIIFLTKGNLNKVSWSSIHWENNFASSKILAKMIIMVRFVLLNTAFYFYLAQLSSLRFSSCIGRVTFQCTKYCKDVGSNPFPKNIRQFFLVASATTVS